MMKIKLLLSGLALLAATTIVSAQSATTTNKQEKEKKATSEAFVDANNNGVCDSYENQQAQGKAGKGKTKGECCGEKKAECGKQGKAPANGQVTEKGKISAEGKGQCKNCKDFVDANNDGICDSKKLAEKK